MIKRFPDRIPQQMHLNSLDALHISSSIRISWHGRLTLLGLKVWTAETSCHLPHLSRCCKTLSSILTENLRLSVIYNILPTNCSQIIQYVLFVFEPVLSHTNTSLQTNMQKAQDSSQHQGRNVKGAVGRNSRNGGQHQCCTLSGAPLLHDQTVFAIFVQK